MTDAADDGQPAFGVKSCLWSTFQIFWAGFGFFAGVNVTISLLMLVPEHLLQRSITAGSEGGGLIDSGPGSDQFLVWLFQWLWDGPVSLIVGASISALFVMAAYDVRAGRPIDWRDYVRAFSQWTVPLVAMAFVAVLLVTVGTVLLIVPGLWLLGMLSVVIPAVVVDRAGLGALGRSRSLTKGYRWPIVGFFSIFFFSIFFLMGALNLMGLEAPSMPYLIITAILGGSIGAMMAVATAVTHMRLREIKEGFALPA